MSGVASEIKSTEIKAMARKQTANLASQAGVPREVPGHELDDEEPASASGKAISKAKAVRDALAHGYTTPEDGRNYVKRVYGIDITKQMFSSYKSQEKIRRAKAGLKGKSGRKPKGGVDQAAEADSYLSPKLAKGEANLLDAMETMKPLVSNLGAEQVKRIVDLLG